MSLRDLILNNRKLLHENESEFFQIFTVTLSKHFDIIMGFNISSFSTRIKVPDEVSAKDWVEARYGMRALVIIQKLIGGEC